LWRGIRLSTTFNYPRQNAKKGGKLWNVATTKKIKIKK
jgi:hypothetical protein